MMNNTVFSKTYDAPDFNLKEIRRYAGVRADEETDRIIDECIKEARNVLTYKVCWCSFDVSCCEEGLDLCFMKTQSRDLAKNLKNCSKIVLFSATVGVELDRLISKYSKIAPSKAVLLHAVGNERIESLCDMFNDEVTAVCREKGYATKPRFSPGYGDLPLDAQKNIFAVLDCPRKIGLTLCESMFMTPSKSVTAIIGIYKS